MLCLYSPLVLATIHAWSLFPRSVGYGYAWSVFPISVGYDSCLVFFPQKCWLWLCLVFIPHKCWLRFMLGLYCPTCYGTCLVFIYQKCWLHFLLGLLSQSNVRCEVEKPHIPNVDTFWQHLVTRGVGGARRDARAAGDAEQSYTSSHQDTNTSSPSTRLHQPPSLELTEHRDRFIGK